MEEQASFVRAVLDDNARLRKALDDAADDKGAALADAEREKGYFRALCGALMAKLNLTRVEVPFMSAEVANIRYLVNKDAYVITYDVEGQPGSFELVPLERTRVAA